MRFVHNQYDRTAVLHLFDQELIEREQNFGLGGARARQVEIVGDHFEKLLDVDARVEEEGELDELRLKIIAQAFKHGGFARSHFAGEDDESFTRLHAVNEIRQRFFVLLAPVEECRIWTQTKRAFREPEESVIHSGRLNPSL